MTVVQADYEMTFDMFWNQYGKVFPGKKVNKNRCVPLWEKLSKTEQVKAYHGIDAYRKGAEKNGRNFFIDPERYLRDKTWQNEY